MSRVRLWIVMAAVGIAIAGCGKGLVPVEGRVTLDGRPLADAMVSFYAEDVSPKTRGSQSAHGRSDAAGRFQLKTKDNFGAFPGKYRVTVSKGTAPGSLSESERTNPNMMEQMAKKSFMPKPIETMPPAYTSPQTTPLHVEVPPAGLKDVDVTVGSKAR